MAHRVTVIWGDPTHENTFLAATCDNYSPAPPPEFEGIQVGPLHFDGPVLLPTHPNPDHTYVQVDRFIPDGINEETLTIWGWRIEKTLPHFCNRAYLTDVLLLTENWTGNFEGWSTQLWLDNKVTALQRIDITIANQPRITVPVRVLETGFDLLGLDTLVVFTPDRTVIDEVGIEHFGWRRESWVKLRRNMWSDLANASNYWETKVQYLLSTLMVERIEAYNSEQRLPDRVREILPADVRVAFEELEEGY